MWLSGRASDSKSEGRRFDPCHHQLTFLVFVWGGWACLCVSALSSGAFWIVCWAVVVDCVFVFLFSCFLCALSSIVCWEDNDNEGCMARWPSGLRRWFKAPVFRGRGFKSHPRHDCCYFLFFFLGVSLLSLCGVVLVMVWCGCICVPHRIKRGPIAQSGLERLPFEQLAVGSNPTGTTIVVFLLCCKDCVNVNACCDEQILLFVWGMFVQKARGHGPMV